MILENLQRVKDIAELCSSIATIVGVPVALSIYYLEKRRERNDREFETWSVLDERYREYLKLCLQSPELDVFDAPLGKQQHLTEIESRKELIIFAHLIATMELAFLLYQRSSKRLRQKQWSGWEDYARDFFARPGFVKAWDTVGKQFDADFMAFMERVRRKQG